MLMKRKVMIAVIALVVLTIASGFYSLYLYHIFQAMADHVYTGFAPGCILPNGFIAING